MLNKNVAELLNTQVNKEFYSAYLYLDFANFYEAKGLNGFANWYKIQAQEERDHALLFYQYLHNNNETELIHTIYAAARDVNDFRTTQFLDWFVKEQGEEETNANDLITKMELFGSDPKGLYMLDNELGARTYTAPSLTL